MVEEQEILATSFYTLVNSLAKPVEDPEWEAPPIENLRVAVVTSDMGLQWGEDGSTQGSPGDVPTCSGKGDDGEFQGIKVDSIDVASGVIKCDPDGDQCPTDQWSCESHLCMAPGGDGATQCPSMSGSFAETTADDTNADFATQVCCLAQAGKDGCGVEQQLEASVRSLTRSDQDDFLVDTHVLAVIVVSDEEDCSISDNGLFATPEFENNTAGGLFNTACNLPASNEEDFLFDTGRYKEKLVGLKENPEGVFFAAIVGVPIGDSGGCEGLGSELGDCLENDEMQLKVENFVTPEGDPYKHFAPACIRSEGAVEVTSARPGRRYVKVAEDFGKKGIVYSICNADWSEAMKEIAEMIVECIAPV
jgi:hypothetical protein